MLDPLWVRHPSVPPPEGDAEGFNPPAPPNICLLDYRHTWMQPKCIIPTNP